MKVLLTGATGFLGSHIYHSLKDSNNKCFALVRNPQKAKVNNIDKNIIKGHLSSSGSNDWIQYAPPILDKVIHCAGLVHTFNTNEFFKINFDATKVLVNDLKNNYKDEPLHFVYISSLAATGPACSIEYPINYESLAIPVSAYGESKLMTEQWLEENLPTNWKLTIIRPPMIMGPNDPALLDIFKMVKSRYALRAQNPLRENFYSFIFIDDLVSIINNIKDQKLIMPSYPEVISFTQLINTIKKLLKNKCLIISLPFFILNACAKSCYLLNKLVTVNFRLTPDKLNELKQSFWINEDTNSQHDYQYNLEESVKKTLKDYQERKWL